MLTFADDNEELFKKIINPRRYLNMPGGGGVPEGAGEPL